MECDGCLPIGVDAAGGAPETGGVLVTGVDAAGGVPAAGGAADDAGGVLVAGACTGGVCVPKFGFAAAGLFGFG